jgi:8-oxo-dGTP pyrophosphatase MutT (NUDIX family)
VTVRPWRRAGPGRTVHRDRWIHLRAEAWETGNGAVLDPWYMLEWRDWVHVLALTPARELVLVRQWRPGAGEAVLELPGGIMEAEDTDPVAAARREFLDETGHDATGFRPFLSLSPEPAHNTNRIHFVLAEGARRVAEQRLDEGEEVAVELHPASAVLAGLQSGLMLNASHVGAVLLGLREAGHIAF